MLRKDRGLPLSVSHDDGDNSVVAQSLNATLHACAVQLKKRLPPRKHCLGKIGWTRNYELDGFRGHKQKFGALYTDGAANVPRKDPGTRRLRAKTCCRPDSFFQLVSQSSCR